MTLPVVLTALTVILFSCILGFAWKSISSLRICRHEADPASQRRRKKQAWNYCTIGGLIFPFLVALAYLSVYGWGWYAEQSVLNKYVRPELGIEASGSTAFPDGDYPYGPHPSQRLLPDFIGQVFNRTFAIRFDVLHNGKRGDPTATNLCELKSLSHLRKLVFNGSTISDEEMACITNISQLNILELRGTRISNKSIPLIIEMPYLNSVTITDSQIDSEGLIRLIESGSLSSIYAGRELKTDDVLRAIEENANDTRVAFE